MMLVRWLGCVAMIAALGATSALAQTPAAAQTQVSVRLDELTWPELKARIDAGATTIIVPIGGTEQNGPHMALGKHNVRATLLAERVARTLGNALVAPVIAYVPEGSVDPPTAHMRFPGTLSIPVPAFEAVLEGAARSLRRAGFRDIVLLGDHGGYLRSVAAVASRLDREWRGTGVRVLAPPEYYHAADQAFAATLAARGFRAEEIGTHAGLADTALTLALAPALVRVDRMHAQPSAADGVYGDPRRSSAELGAIGVDAIVAETVAAIRNAARR
ncbi:MAG: creatininase family protein [Betaproteobacteria bacterium]